MFYIRHQAAGVLLEHGFEATPTSMQIEAALRFARVEERFGKTHPKTGVPYWHRIESDDGQVIGHTEAMSGFPGPIELADEADKERARLQVNGSGKGTVSNPRANPR